MFIDYTKVELRAGEGGQGAVSFRREKYVPKGGPSGGDGGRGGHIIFVVNPNLHTLRDIRYKRLYKAENGKAGGPNQKTGRDGSDVYIPVPPGTVVKNSETGEVVVDLVEPGQEFIVCRGGQGGRGNARFKSATHRSPRYAQPGLPGEQGVFELELKVLADVGLVGLPNAGKSTLLSKVSSARPKIADYPFTTLQPHLGIVKYAEYKSFVMADIPGLIEGASEGKGLGHQFLRHVERNRLLLFLIDICENNPVKTYEDLKKELYRFNRDLQLKPSMVVRTKCDLAKSGEINNKGWNVFDEPFIDISSVTGEGIQTLMKMIVDKLNETR